MDSTLQLVLSEAVGAPSVLAESNVVVAVDLDALVTIIHVLSEASAPFSATSSAPGRARKPASDEVVISLERMTALEPHPGALTLRAEPGATVAALRSAGERAGLAVVGLPAKTQAEHVGALLARGEVPRRSLCGIEAVLSNGDLVKTAVGVLKDVVGYDLPALLLGSMGGLAVIVAATFRLEAARAHTPVQPAPGIASGLAGSAIAGAFDPQGLLRARN